MKSMIWAGAGQGVTPPLKFSDKCWGRSRGENGHTRCKPGLSESQIVLHLSRDYFIFTAKHLVSPPVLSLTSEYCTPLLKENNEEVVNEYKYCECRVVWCGTELCQCISWRVPISQSNNMTSLQTLWDFFFVFFHFFLKLKHKKKNKKGHLSHSVPTLFVMTG